MPLSYLLVRMVLVTGSLSTPSSSVVQMLKMYSVSGLRPVISALLSAVTTDPLFHVTLKLSGVCLGPGRSQVSWTDVVLMDLTEAWAGLGGSIQTTQKRKSKLDKKIK